MRTFWTLVVIIILAGGGYFAFKSGIFGTSTPQPAQTAATTTPAVVNTVAYSCDQGKSINASFTQSDVTLALSDGRQLTLPQTQSGSGIRYELSTTTAAGSSTDIVFSSEGDNAVLTENSSTTYQDCLAGTVVPGGNTNTFTDEGKTFTFTYPASFSVTGGGGGYTQSWMVNATTSGMILAEIKVPQSYEPGTNFGDATFSVGTSADPSALATCLTYNPTGGRSQAATTTSIGGTTYTVFHSSDAGAGNYYDTTSYRTTRNNQCYAIEYTIHYANFQNFPKGSVKQFDEKSVASTLDGIAQTFTFLQ